MNERMDNLKALAEEATGEMMIQKTKVDGLKKFLEDTQSALESTDERVSQLTDGVVVAFVIILRRREGELLSFIPIQI